MKPEIEALIPKPRNAFWKIQCSACNNEQVVFSAGSSKIACVACNQELAVPTGHALRLVKAKLLEEFGGDPRRRKKKAQPSRSEGEPGEKGEESPEEASQPEGEKDA